MGPQADQEEPAGYTVEDADLSSANQGYYTAVCLPCIRDLWMPTHLAEAEPKFTKERQRVQSRYWKDADGVRNRPI